MTLPPLIGREHHLTEILHLLADPNCRLLTLHGPGGIGKTRLALEIAQRVAPHFANGVHLVFLQPIASVDSLVPTIAGSLGIQFFGSDDPRAQLVRYLRSRHTLLVLDNFEHLLDGAELLVDLLDAPQVKLLVTSREALNVREEWRYPVVGLAYPSAENDERLESYGAVQVFVESVRRLRRDFVLDAHRADVIRICQKAEGLPLALELAAGWIKVLSSTQIAAEMQASLDFLTTNTRNVPERHRSMAAAFAQSWRLLPDEEQAAFRRLSVFRGGFTREAAEHVAGASLQILAALVDKSFLRVSSAGRYDVHELLRQYGEAQLAATGESRSTQDAHCRFYAGFMQQSQVQLKGAEQLAGLNQIRPEINNVHTAWRWAAQRVMACEIRQMMESLYIFHQIDGSFLEAEELFRLAAETFKTTDETSVYFHLYMLRLRFRCNYYWDRVALELLAHLPHLLKKQKLIDVPMLSFFIAILVKHELLSEEDGKEIFQLNLARCQAQDDQWGIGWLYTSMGTLNAWLGKHVQARFDLETSIHIFRDLGDRWSSAWPFGALCELEVGLGNLESAYRHLQVRISFCEDVGDKSGVVWGLDLLASVALKLRNGNYEDVSQFLRHAFEVDETVNNVNIEPLLLTAAKLFLACAKPHIAVEVLAFLRKTQAQKSATIWPEIKQYLDDLAVQLPRDVYQIAVQKGEAHNVQTVRELALREINFPSATPIETQPLTEREVEVLHLVAGGLSNTQIAERLVVSVGTVKTHIHNIYGKLNVESRTQAVARARALNLLEP